MLWSSLHLVEAYCSQPTMWYCSGWYWDFSDISLEGVLEYGNIWHLYWAHNTPTFTKDITKSSLILTTSRDVIKKRSNQTSTPKLEKEHFKTLFYPLNVASIINDNNQSNGDDNDNDNKQVVNKKEVFPDCRGGDWLWGNHFLFSY